FVDKAPKPARSESVFRPYHFRYIPGRHYWAAPSPRCSSPYACSTTARLSFTRRIDFAGVSLFLRALSEAADCRKSKGHIGLNPNIIVTVPISYSVSSIIRSDRLAISSP
ncbi:hypothetical protein D6C88_09716, partial [Aureobasidium pullulans]